MKRTAALLLATAFAAGATLSASPTAVERQGIIIQGGLQFQKTIVLNQALLGDGSVRLEKGSYDVTFESLPGNKVRASFFQGGAKRGEAQGIIIQGGKTQTGPGGGPHVASAHAFGQVGFGPEYGFTQNAGKMDLVVGGQGGNQILIGLLVPAVQKVNAGGAASQKVQPAGH